MPRGCSTARRSHTNWFRTGWTKSTSPRRTSPNSVTGYIRGGCSPIGMKKAFPTYIHATAAGLPFIYVSAGVRGLQLKVAPSDLAACVRATFAEISRKG